MKYKLFVCVDCKKSLIASTYEFSVFDKLIAELDKFGTPWEVTEYGVKVLTNLIEVELI